MVACTEIVLVTGANSGIGFEAIQALMQSDHPYHIILGARSPARAQEAVAQLRKELPGSKSSVDALQVDLESDESIDKAVAEVTAKYGRIDALVNNAGTSPEVEYLAGTVTLREAYMKAYNVNVAGTQVLTNAFMPLLLASPKPRLLFITSELSTLTGAAANPFPAYRALMPFPTGWPKQTDIKTFTAYRASKTALNMAMLNWHGMLEGDGVKVWCLSPGLLATELNSAQGATPGSQLATLGQFIAGVIQGARDGDVGRVIARNRGVQPW